MNNNLDKYLHKALIYSVKVIPPVIAVSYIIDDILMYFGIDSIFINYFSGISFLTLAFLYLTSYALKFCPYHRVPLHYMVVCNAISIYDYYIGVPISDINILGLQVGVFMLFTLLYIYLKFRR